jgi:DNA-binding CsgD family transcriptional regulator
VEPTARFVFGAQENIKERLVLSPRTINAHLTSVYWKLEVNSRAAARALQSSTGWHEQEKTIYM